MTCGKGGSALQSMVRVVSSLWSVVRGTDYSAVWSLVRGVGALWSIVGGGAVPCGLG